MAPDTPDEPRGGVDDDADPTPVEDAPVSGDPPAVGDADSPLVDRWTALDRGWQALALGLAVVAVHLAAQFVGLLPAAPR